MNLRTKLTVLPALFVLTAMAIGVVGARLSLQSEFRSQDDAAVTVRVRQLSALLSSFGEDNFVALAPSLFEQAQVAGGLQQPDFVTSLTLENGERFDSAGDVQIPPPPGLQGQPAGAESLTSFVTEDGVSYRAVSRRLESGAILQVARDNTRQAPVVAGVTRLMLMVSAALVVAAAALGSYFARRLTGPIERLSTATERLVTEPDAVGLLETGERGEVGRLTDNFNTMVSSLRASRAQQRRLIDDAGHELRTPLTALKANADLLRLEGLPPGDRDVLLQSISSEVDELSGLIDELALLGEESGRHRTDEIIDLDDMVFSVAERMRGRHQRSISCSGRKGVVVHGNRQLLDRAVSNLVDNAIKFSDESAPVEVAVVSSDGRTEISVRDQGPGIPPDEIDLIFERFHRSADARSVQGSGLGLSIVEYVAEQHGGEVFARNDAGGGAVVGFAIPVSS